MYSFIKIMHISLAKIRSLYLNFSQTINLAFALVILPSFLLFLFSGWVGFGKSIVNFDLILTYGVILLLSRQGKKLGVVVGSVLVAGICAIAILRILGFVYISDPALILNYIGFLADWPWFQIFVIGAAFLILPGFVCLFLSAARYQNASLWAVPIMLFPAIGADILLGSSRFSSVATMTNVNIATSSAWQAWSVIRQWANTPDFQVTARAPMSMVELLKKERQMPRRVLSVALESWGLLDENSANELILARLRRIVSGKYSVEMSAVPFRGGTLSGEMRELCGFFVRGVPNPVQAKDGLQSECLPSLLRSQGYATWAGHANVGTFYNRAKLYPAFGFEQVRFGPSFDKTNDSCGATLFSGPCDRAVLAAALDHLAHHPIAFSHVMTLETHLPLRPTSDGDFSCDKTPRLPEDLCIYVNRMSNALAEVGDLLTQKPAHPDVVFIYGDHSPPYAAATMRNLFDPVRVPFVKMKRI